jgi:C4-dicarboxylate-binding protein DctP
MKLTKMLGAAALSATLALPAQAEDIKLRMASGHAGATPYVTLMSTFFGPEVTKRVKERTKHTVEFIEGYGGAMVKTADTLEGVQAGIIDVGGYCLCFEPSNVPLHAFQAMLPFNVMAATKSREIARAVYDKTPYMTKIFEDKFAQKHLAIIADNGYNVLTAFDWNTFADIKGKKIGGAGINLKWLELGGAIPVVVPGPEVYTSLQTGVISGVIIFPSFIVNLKWYELAKTYTLAEFGAVSWHALTINKNKFAKLPKEVQDIILEVANEFEIKTGTFNEETYPKQLEALKGFGVNVKPISEQARLDWAKALAAWPQERADEMKKAGLPAVEVFNMALDEAEKRGHKWPVRYVVK